MKISRIFETVFTGVSLVTFAIASSLFLNWEVIQNDIPLTEKSAQIINAHHMEDGIPAFYPGETMAIEREQCSDGAKPVAVYRYFEDHLVHTLQLSGGLSFVGCAKHQFTVELPKVLPYGPYTYKVTVEYNVNPLKHGVKVPLTPLKFVLLDPKAN